MCGLSHPLPVILAVQKQSLMLLEIVKGYFYIILIYYHNHKHCLERKLF